jgi:hypothetical protein
MARVTGTDVQVYLDEDLFPIPENDTFPEEPTFADMVFARLGQIYDTSTWLDTATTPSLIRRIIAMLVAANRYNKKHAEDDDAGNRYAYKLENRAWELVNLIMSDQAVLYDASLIELAELNDPRFWPTDATGASNVLDAMGHIVGVQGSDDIKFRMSASF